MKAILWKEWRENRLPWLIFTLTVIAMMLGVERVSGSGANDAYILTAFMLLGYAAILGAGSVAPEHDSRTLSYILSLPIERWKVWVAKVLTQLMLLLLAAVIIIGVYACSLPAAAVSEFVDGDLLNINAVCCVSLVFCYGVFLSTVLDKTISGVFLSVALAAVSGSIMVAVGDPILFPFLTLVLIASLLATSATTFCHGELLVGPNKYRWAVYGLLGGMLLQFAGLHSVGFLVQHLPINSPGYPVLARDQAVMMSTTRDYTLGCFRVASRSVDPRTGASMPIGNIGTEVLDLLPDGSGYLAITRESRFGFYSDENHRFDRLVLVRKNGQSCQLASPKNSLYVSGLTWSRNGQKALMVVHQVDPIDQGARSFVGILDTVAGTLHNVNLPGVMISQVSRPQWGPGEKSARWIQNQNSAEELCSVSLADAKQIATKEALPKHPGFIATTANSSEAQYGLRPYHEDVLCVTANPDSANPSVTLTLVDTVTHGVKWSLTGDFAATEIISQFSPDGRWLMAPGRQVGTNPKPNPPSLIDLERGTVVWTAPAGVLCWSFDPSGRLAYAVTAKPSDTTCRVRVLEPGHTDPDIDVSAPAPYLQLRWLGGDGLLGTARDETGHGYDYIRLDGKVSRLSL